MKTKRYHKGVSLMLLLALSVCTFGSGEARAAVPAKPSVSLAKRTKTAATIKIKKKGKVSGYQVYMKTSKSGKYQLIMGMKTSSYTIKKLKANKTYYVKVRAFNTRGYHITFGKYSSVLKIKPYKKPVPAPTETPQPSVSPDPSASPDVSASPDPSAEPEASDVPEASSGPEPSAGPVTSPQPADTPLPLR